MLKNLKRFIIMGGVAAVLLTSKVNAVKIDDAYKIENDFLEEDDFFNQLLSDHTVHVDEDEIEEDEDDIIEIEEETEVEDETEVEVEVEVEEDEINTDNLDDDLDFDVEVEEPEDDDVVELEEEDIFNNLEDDDLILPEYEEEKEEEKPVEKPAKPEEKPVEIIEKPIIIERPIIVERPVIVEKPNIIEEEEEDETEEEIEMLNKKDHFAYIKGYEDGSVRPEGNITREEVAAVFYRLLDDKFKQTVETGYNNFNDVDGNRWSNRHISTLSNAKIINGYNDGSFKPAENITRAEVAAIASRFDNLERTNNQFTDVKGHWAEKEINSAAKKGWVKGYNDKSFRPNQKITRAEFVTLVNGVLDRKVKINNTVDGIQRFTDLEDGKWYYENMVEATNGHEYEGKRLEDGSEVWINLQYKSFI